MFAPSALHEAVLGPRDSRHSVQFYESDAFLAETVARYGRDEDRRRALAAGFDDHVVKPVDLAALAGRLAAIGPDERGRAAT